MKVTKEFKIGILVVVAIVAFIWGIGFLKGSNFFSDKFYLYAVYPKIDNLQTANPLQINGYKIGQVRSISLIQKGGKNQVLVKFLISEDVNIPERSTARVLSTDLLGSKVVEVIFNNDSKKFVKSGDTLMAEMEQGLKESFNQQLGPLQAKAENLISSIDSVMSVVSLVLNVRTRDNLDRSFESVRKAIFSLESTAYKLDGMMETGKPRMEGILTHLDGITGNLDKNEQKINNILNNFSNLSDTLARSEIKRAVASADHALGELNDLLTKINQGQGTLGKLAKNDSLYINLNKSADDLDKLLKDVKEHPKRYVHFSLFGKKGG